jgi:hypothetical protein
MQHTIHPWMEVIDYMKLLKTNKKYFETQFKDTKGISRSFS